jgi:hypothetical protein
LVVRGCIEDALTQPKWLQFKRLLLLLSSEPQFMKWKQKVLSQGILRSHPLNRKNCDAMVV